MDNNSKTLSLKKTSPYIDTFRITKGVKFSKAKRHLSQCYARVSSPSPNDYKYQQYQKNKVSPKFSFGKQKKFLLMRKQLKCKTQIPGPGKYQPKQTRTSIKISIPQSDRIGLQLSKDIPAVGTYQIQKQPSKQDSGIKFPKQKRHSLVRNENLPAPNQYYTQRVITKSQHQTFNKSKKLLLKLDTIPGVGQYSIYNFKQKKSPCARITSQRRNDRRYHTLDEPGPANYTSCSVEKYKPQSKLSKVIFTRAKRQNQDRSLIPGPGDYNISQNRQKLKGAFLTSRYFYQSKQQKPGPGKYQPKLDLITEKPLTTRIGKATRLLDSKEHSPSPHDYHPQKAKIHFNSTGFTFPKNKRQFQ